MKKEDDFYYTLKDCWSGRKFIGVASRYCYHTRALMIGQREIIWDEMDWNSMGSYLLEIIEEIDYVCRCRNFFVLKDGLPRPYASNFILNRTFIRSEIDYYHLVEIKDERRRFLQEAKGLLGWEDI